MQRYLLIALGGGLGSMLRYFIGAQAAQRFGIRFPVGTLLINLTACALIGWAIQFLNDHTSLSPAWRFFFPVGFIGGYSTFSTFEWETWRDIAGGAFWTGILYLAVSVVGGLVAVALGTALARRMA